MHYHIYNRGVGKKDIFLDDQDCLRLLNLTKRHIADVMDLLAYAVIPNHYHLYVSVKEVQDLPLFYRSKKYAIGRCIAHMQNAYAKSYHYRYGSIGTGAVFQGRFKRTEVDSVAYKKDLVHYLNANAMHHGLVVRPEDYAFTSLQELLFDQVTPYVNRQMVYDLFGGKKIFFDQTTQAMRRKGFHKDWEWGSHEDEG